MTLAEIDDRIKNLSLSEPIAALELMKFRDQLIEELSELDKQEGCGVHYGS